MEYNIIEKNEQGTLIEIVINNKTYRTFVVSSEAEFNSAVESFYNTVANPKDFTQINLQRQLEEQANKQSALNKLKALGLNDAEIKSIIE